MNLDYKNVVEILYLIFVNQDFILLESILVIRLLV